MPKSLYDNSDITQNSKQLDVLKKNFPNCFDKNGNFISHKMEEIVGNAGLELSKESYALNWLGKSYARLLANENPRTLLKEDKVHNAKEAHKNSENLLIKGDNLEVLKHLSNAYSESIKMIYIDPPYNTGGDGFVYNDDRKFSKEELSRLAGIELDEAKRILEFTSSKSNSHSAWLTFMYPRLYVARELLREDGVIFISIDENESSQLKLLCDEVFGEENFITHFIWKNKKGGGNDSKYVAIEHESIVMYANDENYLEKLFEKYTPKYLKRYSEEDTESKYFWDTFKRKSGKQYYPIVCPDGYILEFDENGNKISWLRSESRFKKDLEKGDIKIIKNPKDEWTVHFKQRLPKGKKPRTILIEESLLDNEATTSDGSAELLNLFNKNIFENPKPTKLILKLLNIISKEEDIILDFFAGSGTTAHSVMALNAEDGGNRKFITVQIAEKLDDTSKKLQKNKEAINFCDSIGVDRTVFEITKARIEKASEQLGDKSGFKIYETSPMFEGYLDDMEELNAETTLFNGKALNAEEIEVLLTTWKAYDGMLLTDDLDEVLFGTYRGYYGKNTLYFMHDGFSMEALQAFIEKLDDDQGFEPSKLIVFGYNFESKHQRELKEALTNYKNKKSIELEMVARY